MKIKCELCNKTDIGRLGKLLNRGWLIVFVGEFNTKVVRCDACKPILWDKKDNFEEFNTEINDAIWKKIQKIRILKSLKGKKK